MSVGGFVRLGNQAKEELFRAFSKEQLFLLDGGGEQWGWEMVEEKGDGIGWRLSVRRVDMSYSLSDKIGDARMVFKVYAVLLVGGRRDINNCNTLASKVCSNFYAKNLF